jgi:hypothetical protein
MSYNFSGSVGAAGAGATISWSGTTSGSVIADSNGNFSETGVITPSGNYTFTPTLAGHNFSPPTITHNNVNQSFSNIDFTTTAIPNAQIVQTAVQINTTGSHTATATFGKNLTAGNGLIVAVMAVDTGGAIAADHIGSSSGAASYASVSDSQNNSLVTIGNGISITADRTNGKTFLVGIYYINIETTGGVSGAADAVTFTFTPISSSGNCVVGLVAFEVAGFYNYAAGFEGTPNDTACTVPTADGGPGTVYVYPGTFPPPVNGNITIESCVYGMFNIACAAATTSDGSTFIVGSETAYDPYGQGAVGELGWVLAASQAAHVNGTYVTLAVQTEFCTGTAENNACTFGSTPSTTGIASVAAAMGFAVGNTPGTGGSGPTPTSHVPGAVYLGCVTFTNNGANPQQASGNTPYIGHVRIVAAQEGPNPYLGNFLLVSESAGGSGAPGPFLGEVSIAASTPANPVQLGQVSQTT